jgi:adenylylsulfate kinase-like enzyme
MRSRIRWCRFILIFIHTPLHVFEQHNTNTMYAKVRHDENKAFTETDESLRVLPIEDTVHVQTTMERIQTFDSRVGIRLEDEG